jgi:putative spermidine/putrescine transport system permease protein
VVTTFATAPGLQTLPVGIFGNLFRPNQAPVVNVVAAVLILLSIIPVRASQRLSSDSAGGRIQRAHSHIRTIITKRARPVSDHHA